MDFNVELAGYLGGGALDGNSESAARGDTPRTAAARGPLAADSDTAGYSHGKEQSGAEPSDRNAAQPQGTASEEGGHHSDDRPGAATEGRTEQLSASGKAAAPLSRPRTTSPMPPPPPPQPPRPSSATTGSTVARGEGDPGMRMTSPGPPPARPPAGGQPSRQTRQQQRQQRHPQRQQEPHQHHALHQQQAPQNIAAAQTRSDNRQGHSAHHDAYGHQDVSGRTHMSQLAAGAGEGGDQQGYSSGASRSRSRTTGGSTAKRTAHGLSDYNSAGGAGGHGHDATPSRAGAGSGSGGHGNTSLAYHVQHHASVHDGEPRSPNHSSSGDSANYAFEILSNIGVDLTRRDLMADLAQDGAHGGAGNTADGGDSGVPLFPMLEPLGLYGGGGAASPNPGLALHQPSMPHLMSDVDLTGTSYGRGGGNAGHGHGSFPSHSAAELAQTHARSGHSLGHNYAHGLVHAHGHGAQPSLPAAAHPLGRDRMSHADYPDACDLFDRTSISGSREHNAGEAATAAASSLPHASAREASSYSPVGKRRKSVAPSPSASSTGAYEEEADSALTWTINDHEATARIFDGRMTEIPPPAFRVQVDKGFKRSKENDSFICQKKNHFQVTLALQLAAEPAYVATQAGMLRVSGLYVVMHGIHLEAPHMKVHLEQSLPDRSKRAFKPVPLEVSGTDVYRVTIGRLHFSEPTANNMRKRGRPNPQQKYFALVVTIAAKAGDAYYTVASLASEKLVVRASNPRQFEAEQNLLRGIVWQRGQGSNSAFHVGNIGINTESPDEALSVIGNIKLSGAIMQPSDRRLKEAVEPASTEAHLTSLRSLRLYTYDYLLDGRGERGEPVRQKKTGVIAQELQHVIPEAVQRGGSMTLPSGVEIDSVLMVDRDLLQMTAIGAVQEMAHKLDALTARLDEVDAHNSLLLNAISSAPSLAALRDSTSAMTIPGDALGLHRL